MRLDLTQVPDVEDFTPIPQGTYLCCLDKVEESVTRDGHPMWKLSFVVREGEHKGCVVFDNMVFSPAALPRVKLICSSFNLDTSEALELTPETICGQDVLLTVDVREYENADGERKKRNNVLFNGYDRPGPQSF